MIKVDPMESQLVDNPRFLHCFHTHNGSSIVSKNTPSLPVIIESLYDHLLRCVAYHVGKINLYSHLN